MPRYRRDCPPGQLVHVISRFVNKEFRVTTSLERSEYLRRVAPIARRTDWKLLSYAQMSSHHHWAAIAGTEPFQRLSKPLNGGFGQWLNRMQSRSGPVFSDRPRTIGFDPELAAILIAYIHNNPVRAGVVQDAAESSWTSHRAYIGAEAAPEWLDVETGLTMCGFDTSHRGRRRFDDFVRLHAGDTRDSWFEGDDLEEVRARLRSELGCGTELGSQNIHHDSRRSVAVYARNGNRSRTELGLVPLEEIIRACTTEMGITTEQLQSRSRNRSISNARRIVLLVAHGQIGRSVVEVASALGINDSSAHELILEYKLTWDHRETVMRIVQKICEGLKKTEPE